MTYGCKIMVLLSLCRFLDHPVQMFFYRTHKLCFLLIFETLDKITQNISLSEKPYVILLKLFL